MLHSNQEKMVASPGEPGGILGGLGTGNVGGWGLCGASPLRQGGLLLSRAPRTLIAMDDGCGSFPQPDPRQSRGSRTASHESHVASTCISPLSCGAAAAGHSFVAHSCADALCAPGVTQLLGDRQWYDPTTKLRCDFGSTAWKAGEVAHHACSVAVSPDDCGGQGKGGCMGVSACRA